MGVDSISVLGRRNLPEKSRPNGAVLPKSSVPLVVQPSFTFSRQVDKCTNSGDSSYLLRLTKVVLSQFADGPLETPRVIHDGRCHVY